jgi:hypothetical protein
LGIKVIKVYPPGFDVYSMLRWLNIVSENDKRNVTVFYGLQNKKNLSDIYKIEELTFFKEVNYIDGHGLVSQTSFLANNKHFLLILFMLMFF